MIVCNTILIILTVLVNDVVGRVKWENIRCSSDTEQAVPEGKVDIGRFPWFGAVQHIFYLGGKTRFAVTSAVLVHPEYAIAPAEDISRIQIETLANNTKLIIWRDANTKYSIDIEMYYLSPDYTDGLTLASIALLQLYRDGEGGTVAPVLPVCLPLASVNTFTDLYAVKMSDETGEIQKEVISMEYVNNKDCEEFYYKNKLNFKKTTPVRSECAAAPGSQTCVWDAGVALVSRQTWGYWKLLGFSVRGPGCSAPARFLPIQDHLFWIEEIITRIPSEINEEDQFLAFRRVSPIKLIMYKAKVRQPREIGQCNRKTRGNVLYKDSAEILLNKNFVQGFYFMSLAQVAEITCATVVLEVSSRTNAAIWVEHHCQQELRGGRGGRFFKDETPRECFVYFKSVSFIEFRFYLSFKAMLEVTLYGKEEKPKFIPSPYMKTDVTYPWRPTYDNLKKETFIPFYVWYWSM